MLIELLIVSLDDLDSLERHSSERLVKKNQKFKIKVSNDDDLYAYIVLGSPLNLI